MEEFIQQVGTFSILPLIHHLPSPQKQLSITGTNEFRVSRLMVVHGLDGNNNEKLIILAQLNFGAMESSEAEHDKVRGAFVNRLSTNMSGMDIVYFSLISLINTEPKVS